ncbi:substrate-binding periplasmic protein [Marinomonas mediterranea]|jgi:ABC-type amino acid transport/signal transduction systems, periplasmic component/domain|uniref:ABC-type transporter, periplasmic subunit family 3 n=1 Tax=Marinomonas mediterranea (strain ATCC 700492 / JCM 21426 / NBRC 103028 / MMB-1) TaxID=717774 RepID=F2JZY2_MARM1|nr:transporter substrate-binding domain-containing protein [Marinomonas mediterranea]ADZ92094.1 ABC-type transporter, periplasmic subunit family 3 [Marinomonas mediterranea MMB-1]WCN10055.1 transporter substrate-binding domain-containing protein [Marinomonas mediterranea]WCN14106.1 transporter substrate-binding domain-containing protein [Marinomonas mediterranea]WCN18161.1 transporter substrate-binding domain-containing protein [Marinomonas mediterranea MMB-1]
MRNSVTVTKFLLAALICVFSSFSWAESRSPVTFYIVDYPPYLIESDDQGKVSGMDVDIVRAAFKEVGIEASIKVMPWKRIVKSMKRGLIAGTISCSIRQERNGYMLFSDPISQVTQVAVSVANHNINDVSSIKDLSKYKVIGVENWGLLKDLTKNGVKFDTTKNIENGITSLLYRDVDVFFNGAETTAYQAKLMGVRHKLAFSSLKDIPSTALRLCVSKAFPHSQEIIEAFSKGLTLIKSNGSYDSIRLHYLN